MAGQNVFRPPYVAPARAPKLVPQNTGDQPPGNVRAGAAASWPSPYWVLTRGTNGAFLFGTPPSVVPVYGTDSRVLMQQAANAFTQTWRAQRAKVGATIYNQPRVSQPSVFGTDAKLIAAQAVVAWAQTWKAQRRPIAVTEEGDPSPPAPVDGTHGLLSGNRWQGRRPYLYFTEPDEV